MICANTYLFVKRTTSLYLGELYLFLSCRKRDVRCGGVRGGDQKELTLWKVRSNNLSKSDRQTHNVYYFNRALSLPSALHAAARFKKPLRYANASLSHITIPYTFTWGAILAHFGPNTIP